jgi:hypothetical protein
MKNVGLYDCAAMRFTALQLSIRRMAKWLIEQVFGIGVVKPWPARVMTR